MLFGCVTTATVPSALTPLGNDTMSRSLPSHTNWTVHNDYSSENLRQATRNLASSTLAERHAQNCSCDFAGSRLNMEWSCGHNGFFSIDWLSNAMVKPKRGKRLIAVSVSDCGHITLY